MHVQWSFVWKFRKKKKEILNSFFQAWRKLQLSLEETKIYGHHGFLVLENMVTTLLSVSETVDINRWWNGICFRRNEVTVQRFCATLVADVFKNTASVICWKMFPHCSHFLCSWFELVSVFHFLETLNYCDYAEMNYKRVKLWKSNGSGLFQH